MRTLQRRIQEVATSTRVPQLVIERDWAQSYVLLGLARMPHLSDALVFKGGTALKKLYLRDYRFSEDLDFTGIDAPGGAELEADVRAAVMESERAARTLADVAMTVARHEERDPHPGGQEAFVVRVRFPWQRAPLVPVKIEITHDEPVLLPTQRRAVAHGYGELFDVAVRAYALEEIAAEKLRATRQTQARLAARGWARPRARDYFDLWHLAQGKEVVDWTRVAAILPKKCAHRGVTIASIADVFDPALLGEVRASWNRTLGPFVAELPNVEHVLRELRDRLDALLRI